MNKIYEINNMVAKISKEHKIITDYVVKFNKSLEVRDRDFFKGIAGFFNFLKKDLLQHFRFEEVVIFPASIVGEPQYENILMIMSLQKEHGLLESQLQVLNAEITALKLSREKLSNELIERIKLFFDELKTHAKREMTDLFPMVDANPKSMSLIEIYAKEISNS